jgi:hypothetical protein
MTNQHRATPDEWAQQEGWANRSVFSDSSCIIELRDRLEALEVRQQPLQDKLDRLIALDRDDPANSLVERVATDEELCQLYYDAPEHGFGPALRAVYDLGRQHGAAPIRSGPESPLVERVGRAAILEVAAWLKEKGYSTLQAEALEQETNQ